MIAPKPGKKQRFEVVESARKKGLGFDPNWIRKGGNATCPFCGTVADSEYVKEEGMLADWGRNLWPSLLLQWYSREDLSFSRLAS